MELGAAHRLPLIAPLPRGPMPPQAATLQQAEAAQVPWEVAPAVLLPALPAPCPKRVKMSRENL